VLSGEASHTYFIVFGLTLSGLELTIYRTRGEHAHHYTTDALELLVEDTVVKLNINKHPPSESKGRIESDVSEIYVPHFSRKDVLTGATSGAGTAYSSGAPEFLPCVMWGSCYSIFSFMWMFCRSLLVLLYFFFGPRCCLLFFDIRILITVLLSSISSLVISEVLSNTEINTFQFVNVIFCLENNTFICKSLSHDLDIVYYTRYTLRFTTSIAYHW
jgi:hypothetical protein